MGDFNADWWNGLDNMLTRIERKQRWLLGGKHDPVQCRRLPVGEDGALVVSDLSDVQVRTLIRLLEDEADKRANGEVQDG